MTKNFFQCFGAVKKKENIDRLVREDSLWFLFSACLYLFLPAQPRQSLWRYVTACEAEFLSSPTKK